MSPTARHDNLPTVFEEGAVTIRRLDNRSLLAMTLRAGRLSKDHDLAERSEELAAGSVFLGFGGGQDQCEGDEFGVSELWRDTDFGSLGSPFGMIDE